MSLDHAEFRRVMGHLASGVTVVSGRDDAGQPCGLTASAVASVSLDTTLVLVCIERAADSHDAIAGGSAFSISVLAHDQERIARRFAELDQDKFVGMPWREEVSGAPVLDGVLAWLDCRVWATYAGGDHTIVVGEVLAGDARDGVPLVYYRGGYGRFTP